MLNITGNKGRGEQDPQPMETGGEPGDTSNAVRPSRTARLKAQEKLKEPTLNVKLRNDGGTAVNIKVERSSTVANSTLVRGGNNTVKEKPTLDQTYEGMETENDANQANRIITPNVVDNKRNDEGFSSASEASKHHQEEETPSAVREVSLMVIAPVVPKVEIVSDEEMPPPIMPPPKLPAPKVRTKKKAPATAGGKSGKEKEVHNDTASSSAVSSADSTMNSTSSSVSSNASSTSGRPIRAKSKMTAKHADVAPEMPTVSKELGVMIEPIRIKTEKLSIVQQPTRTSERSTYEDAQEQQTQAQMERSQLEKQMRPLKIALERMPISRADGQFDLNGTYTTQAMPSDGTFVIPSAAQDGTFTINSPLDNERNAPQSDATFNIPTKDGTTNRSEPSTQRADETFVFDKDGSSTRDQRSKGDREGVTNASIMTEDESVVENSPAQMPKLPEQTKP
uniref:Uncharacterized protein n=1 Tax=Anopheles maculatus TaxID=74869 RepID=A0A182S5W8_9DIPT